MSRRRKIGRPNAPLAEFEDMPCAHHIKAVVKIFTTKSFKQQTLQ